MKKYTNLILLSILAVLFYKTPAFLVDSVSSQVGKLSWLVIIMVAYHTFDKISAVILAVIMITLLHQSTVEGFEGKKEKKDKKEKEDDKSKLNDMEEKEMEEMDKEEEEEEEDKKDKKNKKEDKEENEQEEDEQEEDKEGFTVLSKTKKKCSRYNKEGFTGFTDLLKKLKIPVTNTNTTDLDREIKASAERSTIDSSKELVLNTPK
jgi:FtsZ-interacting cell division protein ZipA